ncbi:hypothetical protein CI238_09692 [Colletotrichum incanum]|uniref:ubiquitinyl hydrolase 1 n=1 Tax=Colletotrichum incanum TaxID=1573173 RepID=A0A162NXM8_COLIC|nr:hypothetical protein CI238_09692 [Colletotrichum incanum]
MDCQIQLQEQMFAAIKELRSLEMENDIGIPKFIAYGPISGRVAVMEAISGLFVSQLLIRRCHPWNAIVQKTTADIICNVRKCVKAVLGYVLEAGRIEEVSCVVETVLDVVINDFRKKVDELMRPYCSTHRLVYNPNVIERVCRSQEARRKARDEAKAKAVRRQKGGLLTTMCIEDDVEPLTTCNETDLHRRACELALDYTEAIYEAYLQGFISSFSLYAVEYCLLSKLPSMFEISEALETFEDSPRRTGDGFANTTYRSRDFQSEHTVIKTVIETFKQVHACQSATSLNGTSSTPEAETDTPTTNTQYDLDYITMTMDENSSQSDRRHPPSPSATPPLVTVIPEVGEDKPLQRYQPITKMFSDNMLTSEESLLYLVHHIFLTPRLPQAEDLSPEREMALIQFIYKVALKFGSIGCEPSEPAKSATSVMQTMVHVHKILGDIVTVDEDGLIRMLYQLETAGDTIPLHIREQNAGVLISKADNALHIESFELSPTNNSVISTKGRLRRSFPGKASSISLDIAHELGFCKTLATTLARMSAQPAPDTQPKAKKAGQLHDEHRDTTHPKMVTELLNAFLEVVGQPLEGTRIWKNTREEVLWKKSRFPWRRSPTWMLIRVSLQLTFNRWCRKLGPGADLYKTFMVFLMAELLQQCIDFGLQSDIIYSMTAKLSRRLLKLGSDVENAAVAHVREQMCHANKLLHDRWTSIQKHDSTDLSPKLSRLASLNFVEDTAMQLSELDSFLASLNQRRDRSDSSEFNPSWTLVQYRCDTLPQLVESSDRQHLPLNLVSFESWVETNLQTWLELQLRENRTDICARLRHIIESYHRVSSCMYDGNPESTSVMLLTLLELWIACDTAAIHTHPLLHDYDPGIPLGLFQNLLLPSEKQMRRLLKAETYVIHRSRNALSCLPASNIYTSFGTSSSFAVRFFNQSPSHQVLLDKIQEKATSDRKDKRHEFADLKAKHDQLMYKFHNSQCQYDRVFDYEEGNYISTHKRGCTRCSYQSQAKKLQIYVHEWPLPMRELEAKSVVFELDLPKTFGHWREASTFLLLDVLKLKHATQNRPQSYYALRDYGGLSNFFYSNVTPQHIGLLSGTKPNEVTHRNPVLVATAIESQVCLNNGLRFAYYDDRRCCFMNSFEVSDAIPEQCTYKLSESSIALQRFLFRPASNPNGPSPNTVIATQNACPDGMALDEYKALAQIPLGYRIQWQNILIQLFSPTIDFKKRDVGLIVLQCIYQTGPASDSVARGAHSICEDTYFAYRLLEGIRDTTCRFEENWQSSTALSTFISLTCRLLSLTQSSDIEQQCLKYLSDARRITLAWAKLIRKKARSTLDDEEKIVLQRRAIEVLLICSDTFNTNPDLQRSILSVDADASVFLQCSIGIQEYSQSLLSTLEMPVQFLYSRWQKVSYHCYRFLAAIITKQNCTALDDAIKASWTAYKPSGCWRVLSETRDHWLTSSTGTSTPLSIHFSLVTGELLVSGVPLDHLPSDYLGHRTYQRLFGRLSLEIMLSPIPGMQFSSKTDYADHEVHLCLASGGEAEEPDLLVHAVKDDVKLDLVPSHYLRGKIPNAFVHNYVHWYNHNENCVDFYDARTPWKYTTPIWKLRMSQTSGNWSLSQDQYTLININSESATILAEILAPLEERFWIHIMYRSSNPLIYIDLHRPRLEFSLRPGDTSVISRQYRGMAVDPCQSISTLTGLQDKLILKVDNPKHPALPAVRKVLVPEGLVTYVATKDHIKVTVNKAFDQRVQAYDVNEKLGKLASNGDRQSTLFLCYLHALTSFCLPDPLSGKTGTEEALSILKSASVQSFDVLTKENVQTLVHLAKLTPGRSYYPAHERVMQTVDWLPNLSFLSQHGFFLDYVRQIFDDSARSQFFHPQSYFQPPTLDHTALHLLQRDDVRSSTFRVSKFGAERHSTAHDQVYTSRDRDISLLSSRAYSISQVIFIGQPILAQSLPIDIDSHLWNYLKRAPVIYGCENTVSLTKIAYDAGLLLESSHFIAQNWVALHKNLLTTVGKFDLMIWLATLAFASDADMTVIQTMASFRTTSELIGLCAPQAAHFKLAFGTSVNKNDLRVLLGTCLRPFDHCPESNLHQNPYESSKAFKQRCVNTFHQKQNQAISSLVDCLTSQWPCKDPQIPFSHNDQKVWCRYMNVGQVMPRVKDHFERWHDNLRFKEYLQAITKKLPSVVLPSNSSPQLLTTSEWTLPVRPCFVSDDDKFSSLTAPLSPTVETQTLGMATQPRFQEREYRLHKVLQKLEKRTNHVYEKRYVNDLHASLKALQRADAVSDHSQISGIDMREDLVLHLQGCQRRVDRHYGVITKAILGAEAGFGGFQAKRFDFYSRPRLSPTLILQRLNKDHIHSTPEEWKKCIAEYATAITQLQRAERMLACWDDPATLNSELRNPGHTNWNPLDYPDTLLLEVESGIMVRRVQENIAERMRDPPSAKNAVMQLNMGEGKSSVIVPIVAAALANGSRLVRIVVAKPQSKQMLQMLESKLGGILNRRVFHLPFSRALKIGLEEAEALGSLCRDCMESGGVLLVQPEHILSFQLMGIESAISGRMDISRSLLRTKDFFDRSSRDIVDESDENFSVKFELVYTIGTQQSVEYSPFRWECVHHVLKVIRQVLPEVPEEWSDSIEISRGDHGCFPRLRILTDDAKESLLGLAAHYLSIDGTTGLPMANQPRRIQDAVYTYISKPNLTPKEIESVEGSTLWSASTKNTLFLLRGLIALQVLAFSFCQKRWRVDFGLDPTRNPATRLAVPYRAKDNPTARSEFSHTDVTITLTSLSYYYGGLTDSDMFLSFHHLVRSDQADMEYSVWVADSNLLPPAFRQLSGVNLEDRQQCIEQVFPCLKYAKGVIDYFINHIVFPKELKTFPHKLSASGWDIGEERRHPTTGFSGTNDSRAFLPLTVSQLDDREQQHTNALVMEYLLQHENSVALMPKRNAAQRSDAEALLEMVTRLKPPVRVILDVGAQVLELDNVEVAKRWLDITDDYQDAQAVIFFDGNDQTCVLDRQGRVETFQTSPYASQTDVCLVFLDEAHTRGTDLKLPDQYRAAVTLGANLTKDRLVQACMRMRKLGRGQSVIFCVPEEIQQKINPWLTTHNATISVADILEWTISETLLDLRRGIWLWANQGRRRMRHEMLWEKARDGGLTRLDSQQAENFLEDEARTLETMYRPIQQPVIGSPTAASELGVDAITERLLEFGGPNPDSVTFREEQERELSPEVEQEREVQKPPPANPAVHSVHPDIRRFVSQGMLTTGSEAYMPAFVSLRDTSAAQHCDVGRFPRDLLVTADFARTIIPFRKSYISDLFQRSVQWILTSASGDGVIDVAIIISPYEAYELLPDILKGSYISLHLYAPRPNMGFRALDSLDLYTIPYRPVVRSLPRRLVTELNLFSGQLYVRSLEEYADILAFLGLSHEPKDDESDNSDQAINMKRGVGQESRILFMKVFMTQVRKNCATIDKTHLGRILDHRSLQNEDFV